MATQISMLIPGEWPASKFSQIGRATQGDGGRVPESTGVNITLVGVRTDEDSYAVFTDKEGRFIVKIIDETRTLTFITQKVHLEIGGNSVYSFELNYILGTFSLKINGISILLEEEAESKICYIHPLETSTDTVIGTPLNNAGHRSFAGQYGASLDEEKDLISQVGDSVSLDATLTNIAFAFGLFSRLTESETNYANYDHCFVMAGDGHFYAMNKGVICSNKILFHQNDLFEFEVIEFEGKPYVIGKHNNNIIYKSLHSSNLPLAVYFSLKHPVSIGRPLINNGFIRALQLFAPKIDLLLGDSIRSFLNKRNISLSAELTDNVNDILIQDCKRMQPELANENEALFASSVRAIALNAVGKRRS